MSPTPPTAKGAVDAAAVASLPTGDLRHTLRLLRDLGRLALLTLGLALAILIFAGHFQLSQAQTARTIERVSCAAARFG
jgi:hypothetical protein